jgi:hypothetical protein
MGMGPPFGAIGLGQVPKGLIGGMDDYRCRLVVFVPVLAIAKSPPPAATWYDSGASHHMERTGHSPFLACECRRTPLRGRRSSVSRLLTTAWIMALVLPHAMCTLDEGPRDEASTKLQACEARVKHLTAEIGRLQAHVVSLQRAGGEPIRGDRDGAEGGGGAVRVATGNEAPSGTLAPSEMPITREDSGSDDVHRRRQEDAGARRTHVGCSSCPLMRL